jgi:hypothetical protein
MISENPATSLITLNCAISIYKFYQHPHLPFGREGNFAIPLIPIPLIPIKWILSAKLLIRPHR